jgi:hypothetical protein
VASLRLPVQLIWDGDAIRKWIAVSSFQDPRPAVKQMQDNDIVLVILFENEVAEICPSKLSV